MDSDMDNDQPGPSGRGGGGQGRPSKKARTAEVVFPKGTIKKIRVHDFMTYNGTVTITPGARLNLVLGPNGTGKSSLVCALCVGLGGSTKNLGRADNLCEYVRRGVTKAWTEITLSGGPGAPDKVVRREIEMVRKESGNGHNSRSKWKLNGQEKADKEIAKMIKEENIQFDNLCQFLPQDKVVEFSGLDPVRMLEATEKAIGNAELDGAHKRLIELTRELQEAKLHLGQKEKELAGLQAQQQAQQRDYDRFAAKQKLQKEVEMLEARILWLEVQARNDRRTEVKAKLKEAEAVLAARTAEISSDERPIRATEERGEKLAKSKAALVQAAAKEDKAGKDALARLEKHKEEVDDTLERRQGLKEESKKLKELVRKAEQEVQKAKDDVAAQPERIPTPEMADEDAQLRERLREVQSAMHELDAERLGLEGQEHHLNMEITDVEGRLRNMNDQKMQRLRKLDAKKHGMGQMHQWVQQELQAGRFRGPVYGPVGMEVDATEQLFANVVEHAIFFQLYNFVVTCREDEQKVTEQLRSMRIQNVSVSAVTDRSPRGFPYGPAQMFTEHGVIATVDDVIKGPPEVKIMLADLCSTNRIYLAKNDSDELINAIRDGPGSARGGGGKVQVWTHNTKCTISGSAYNRDTRAVSRTDYKPFSQFLEVGNAPDFEQQRDELNSLGAKKVQARDEVRQQLNALQARIRAAHAENQQVTTGIQRVHAAANNLKKKKDTAQRVLQAALLRLGQERNKADPLTKMAELNAKLKGLMGKLVQEGKVAAAALHNQWAAVQKVAITELAIKECDMQVTALRAVNEGRQRAKAEAKAQVDKWRKEKDSATQAAKDAHSAAKARTGEMTDKLREELEELPDTVEECSQLAQEKEAEASQIVCNNQNVVNEFRQRERRITDLQKEVQADTARVQEVEQEQESVKLNWLPELQRIVGIINDSFSSNFCHIGCAGEVVLHEDEDFSKYAIQIRVKFRPDEPFQVLDKNRQSGGERSVSTMLYLIALQGVAKTPFRVVDEINQGMDPHNERRVFEHLVRSSCQEGTPQCFLLTPKLLPDLPFTGDITTQVIMNGPHIDPNLPAQFNTMEGLFGARYSEAAAAVAAH